MAGGHYFERQPAVESRPVPVKLQLPDWTVDLAADRGVFSQRRVDTGTVALLRSSPSPPAGTLVDLGCGYGPIALTLAHRNHLSEVWAVDVNSRALGLVRDNATRLELPNVRTCSPDEFPSELAIDGIWSNPPIRIGKEALHALLSLWLERLAPQASAWLVVHRNLGSDSLGTWLSENCWPVSRVASKHGYRVLRVGPRPQEGP